MSKTPVLKMKLPKLKKKRVWIGAYGGHFDIVVVFQKRPIKLPDDTLESRFRFVAQSSDEPARIDREEFEAWFGVDIEPTATEVDSVREYDLTGVFDRFGQLCGLDVRVD